MCLKKRIKPLILQLDISLKKTGSYNTERELTVGLRYTKFLELSCFLHSLRTQWKKEKIYIISFPLLRWLKVYFFLKKRTDRFVVENTPKLENLERKVQLGRSPKNPQTSILVRIWEISLASFLKYSSGTCPKIFAFLTALGTGNL